MGTQRSTAPQRRVDAVDIGMRVFADHGLTTASVQKVADQMGVSQPYVFRLFGSKRDFFLACMHEMEARIRRVLQQAATQNPGDPLPAMRAGFRALIADGVVTGLWLQACAAARSDEAVAAGCRAVIGGILDEAEHWSTAGPGELRDTLALGALVVMLQALSVDVTGGSQAAIDSLRGAEATW
ncbi:TetR/AcrR family transcriptional regulator [Micromonospora endolithica]|uniref:TetR/AcrR family transcriptional regulator n=1 Tax=Micromonospora endolithica TaxID=230091 RepID=A0A3A9ZA52_9ACTN|nr:TetR/AcrR family transcriptional regulator [Micromonospora endolithica]RKN45281.1 TetR/AcrR family transcriptional regulator [Micromonospora endolithica]TWJ23030.1 TetR family transcriptional regulator [Micromonospora endolithica]